MQDKDKDTFLQNNMEIQNIRTKYYSESDIPFLTVVTITGSKFAKYLNSKGENAVAHKECKIEVCIRQGEGQR